MPHLAGCVWYVIGAIRPLRAEPETRLHHLAPTQPGIAGTKAPVDGQIFVISSKDLSDKGSMSNTARKVDRLAAPNRAVNTRVVEYLDHARAHPFVKWAGGKRTLIQEIVKVMPKTFNTYWEPFLGGGAVFFALDSRISDAKLSDINLDLMLTYRALDKYPDGVIGGLQNHARRHNRRYYPVVRNRHDLQDLAEIAARFIYLNKTCYNGLYRVNKKGRFNVPIGSHKNPSICDEDNLRAVSKVLKKATIKWLSFRSIEPQKGDFVYCDPPYDGTFTGYTGEGFGPDDQKALRDMCMKWRNNGAYVVISNSDTTRIRRLYKDFDLHEVSAPKSINSDGSGRGKKREFLIIGR